MHNALGSDSAKLRSSNPPIINPEIDGRAALDGERKPVTALFADIKGSMELMEDLDLAGIQWLMGFRRRRVVQWWSAGFDLLLTPAVWEPPVTLYSMMPEEGKPSELRAKIDRQVFFTNPFKITGQPAISLPLHWTPAEASRRDSARRSDGPRRPADSGCLAAGASATMDRPATSGTRLNRNRSIHALRRTANTFALLPGSGLPRLISPPCSAMPRLGRMV